ncbi:MAG TPA: phosphotransferase [Thermoanaerobaculia bacterium]|nr:phosphotransferase [Thermoanaerobaculia bacterium]
MSPEQARRAIAAALPGVVLRTLAGPFSGLDNHCFRAELASGGGGDGGGDPWIFRFPSRAATARLLERELLVLPRLGAMPLRVPDHALVGEPTAVFPRRFVGYRAVPGEPLTRERLEALPAPKVERIAERMGAFLAALHSYPLARLEADEAARGVALERKRLDWLDGGAEGLRRRSDAALAEHRQHPRWAEVRAAVLAAVDRDAAAWTQDSVLCHGELDTKHVLFSPATGELTGLIDFGEVALDDRTVAFDDLRSLYGRPFADRALAAYDHPEGDRLRRKVAAIDRLRAVVLDGRRRLGLDGGAA